MKKFPSAEFIVIVLALLAFAIYSWLYPPFSCGPVDNTPLAEKVKSRLGMDLKDLENSLALTPVVAGEEPFILSYSVPLKVDAATCEYLPSDRMAKTRMLALLDNGKVANGYEIDRQTNGTYLVKWNTIFASYGPHILQMRLYFAWTGAHSVDGPRRTETVTNVVQWEYDSFGFGRKRTWFHGFLHVPSADYRIEIYDTNNVLIKTIDATNKWIIDEIWDYKPENGQPYSAEDFKAKVFVRPALANTNSAMESNTNWVFVPYL